MLKNLDPTVLDLKNLDPTVLDAVIKILAAVYETGKVEEVNVGIILQLFGVIPNKEQENGYLSFNDPGWIEEYMAFKAAAGEVRFLSEEESDVFLENLNPNRTLH